MQPLREIEQLERVYLDELAIYVAACAASDAQVSATLSGTLQ